MARGRRRIKRALLVGINKYEYNGIDLNGCVNDVNDVYTTIIKYCGFLPKNITILKNEDATKDNILNELNSMVYKTKSRQEAFYYHSGHGSQIEDTNSDESDSLDECIIPHDFQNWEDVIIDDEIATIFKTLTDGGFLSMACDTCYSGGANKGIGTKTIENNNLTTLSKDINISHFGIMDKAANDQNHILLSACSEGEVSYEFQHPKYGYRGAFTFLMCRNIYNMRKFRGIDCTTLWSRVYNALYRNSFNQHPTIYGSSYLKAREFIGGNK